VSDKEEGHRRWSVEACGEADSFTMGFFERNRKALEAQGIDPSRLPPGQYQTDRFPVLHVGSPTTYADDLSDWDLRIFGLVERELTLTFEQLRAMPTVDVTTDIHCVTKWSKFDTVWTGVRIRHLYESAGASTEATHVVMHGESGYTANLPLDHTVGDDALVTWAFDGEPLEADHGYPVRTLVPHLYFWKSVKWLRAIELTNEDRPGFWEQNGYHNLGEPFAEQRFSGD
jgi:DMSO/TMAO reductase YedYZ molybdopterin-dependent catalytic subunit